jgi:hypothetical protein
MGEVSRTKLTITIVSGIWSLALLILGVQLSGWAPKVLFALPSVVLLFFLFFNSWLWQLLPVRRIIARPQLNGTWSGNLVSMRNDSGGVEAIHDPIPIFFVIRQSYLEVSVTLISRESKSRSTIASIDSVQAGDFVLHYLYANRPHILVRDRSPQHSGGGRIEIVGIEPASLVGEYWTDRKSLGTFKLTKISSKTVGTFEDGQQLQKES